MIGIRLCTGRTRSFAVVVRMAQVKSGGPDSGRHASHIPTNAKGLSSARRKAKGCFALPSRLHSKKPLAGMRQRRLRRAADGPAGPGGMEGVSLVYEMRNPFDVLAEGVF